MPDRFVREGFLRSATINDLPVEAQLFYVRVLLLVDDFGCYDGRDVVIASQAYPTLPTTTEHIAQVITMLEQLHAAGLIVRYSNRGRPYIAITQWKCGIRGRRAFPAPPVDVDLPTDVALRGQYGRPIGWNNPAGSDPTSILLDEHGRAVVPQPDEWRPHSHYAPVTRRRSDLQPVTGEQSLENGRSDWSTTTGQQPIQKDKGLPEQSPPPSPEVLPAVTEDQSLSATTAPTTNGVIKFENGSFVGLTEAQRVAWQEMFDDIRIPDQVARAAAWLSVNNAERDAIEKQGEGFGSFIVRWLLREARPHSPHTGHAS